MWHQAGCRKNRKFSHLSLLLTLRHRSITRILESKRALVNVISTTCAFPTMTYQNVCCKKGLLITQSEFNSCASPAWVMKYTVHRCCLFRSMTEVKHYFFYIKSHPPSFEKQQQNAERNRWKTASPSANWTSWQCVFIRKMYRFLLFVWFIFSWGIHLSLLSGILSR